MGNKWYPVWKENEQCCPVCSSAKYVLVGTIPKQQCRCKICNFMFYPDINYAMISDLTVQKKQLSLRKVFRLKYKIDKSVGPELYRDKGIFCLKFSRASEFMPSANKHLAYTIFSSVLCAEIGVGAYKLIPFKRNFFRLKRINDHQSRVIRNEKEETTRRRSSWRWP